MNRPSNQPTNQPTDIAGCKVAKHTIKNLPLTKISVFAFGFGLKRIKQIFSPEEAFDNTFPG